MKKALIALAAAFIAVFTFADGESLAETGGFVTTEPQLAFKGITLDDLGTTVFPCANMGGVWIGEAVRGSAAAFCNRTAGTDATGEYVRYEVQFRDGGSAKVVAVKFRQSGGDVTVQAVATGYSTANGAVDIDFTSALTDGRWDVQLATAADADGYGVFGLKLAQPEDFSSINVNFTYANSAELTTSDAAGAPGFAVPGPYWTQKKGVVATYNTVNILGMVDGAYVQSQLPGSTLAISGTRGTYANGTTYAAATDIRYGYIDEDENNTTPSVTVSNVPFEFYRVVVYSSTDNTDVQFGYVTVNGVGYCSANASKDDTQAYATAEGTQSWGKSSVAGYLEGVNYLVTPVLKATDARTVAVVGHKVAPARGCIAAIQIVKATAEIAKTAITAADINAAVPSGESALKIPADATITLDAALTASKVKFVSDGTVTLSAASRPSAEELAKLDFTYVKGAVLRSWLTPGVVGFNFNANGGLSNGGTENGAADTSLALEIGEWHANASDASGTSIEMFSDGLSTLTWKSANVYAESDNLTDGTFIQGYLDDGNGGVQITLSAVPYETYDVIIYCSTDKDNSTKGFKAKTVNGTIYTWDSATGAATTTTDANAVWGLASLAAGKAVYGANTIRINGLSGALSILGGTNSNNGRGGIAAIQIMPAGTSTAPTMTVGEAGEATAATWTDDTLWEGGVVPSSGTAKLIVSGDVTLTIDDDVSLSAVTVEGEGTLTLVESEGKTVEFYSLLSQVQVILPDDSVSIAILSAPVKYLYKTGSLVSTPAGNTYTQGEGTSEAAATIAHNGGSATLTGGTYYLGESMNATATTVDFVDATAVYSSPLSVGMATYIIEGTSSITTPRIVLSNGGAGRTSVMTLKDTASLTVTGGVDGDTNQGNMFGHWNGPSTFTIQDNAIFTCTNYEILVGRTANTQTININGGVFTTKGIMVSGQYQGTYALNMNGGVLALGSLGIGTYHAGWTIPVTVSGANEIRATAETLPIGPAVTLAQGSSLAFTKVDGVETSTVTLASVSGAGAISIGAGVTLDIGKNRPTGEITVDDDGVLAVTMTDKSDAPVFKVSAQPKNIVLRAPDDATEYAVEYDADAGTITIKPPRPIWTAKEDSAFDTVGNWSSGNLPGNGQDAAVNFAADTDMTVSGTYTLGDLAFTGSGNATVSGEGSIVASSYDFSATTGRIEYNLPTGAGSIAAGADTVLMQNGSGELVIAPDTKLTLAAPWGTVEGNVATFNGGFAPKERSVLTIAPGEGMIQKTVQPVLYEYQLTTIAISNGTLLVDFNGGGKGYFAGNSVRIDDGGILSLEKAIDLTGYDIAVAPLTINEGGTLQVKMRDTLRRPVVLNGGTMTVEGADSGRALDIYNGNTFTVNDDSELVSVATDGVAVPKVYCRNGNVTFDVASGKTLTDGFVYAVGGANDDAWYGIVKTGAGTLVQNTLADTPFTYTGNTAINAGTYKMNATHENNGREANSFTGVYTVADGARLSGTGAITGTGGVTLAAAGSKLAGSLTIKNLTASAGARYGESYDPAENVITGSFTAGGTQTVNYGSLTIGKDCDVTDITNATFSIAANGNLKIEKDLTVAGLTVAAGGTITLVGSKSNGVWDVPELTVTKTTSYPETGTVNVVLDFGESNPPAAFKVKLPTGVITAQSVTVSDSKKQRKWRISSEGGNLYATSDGGFRLIIR